MIPSQVLSSRGPTKLLPRGSEPLTTRPCARPCPSFNLLGFSETDLRVRVGVSRQRVYLRGPVGGTDSRTCEGVSLRERLLRLVTPRVGTIPLSPFLS